jgi:hypothetical protein
VDLLDEAVEHANPMAAFQAGTSNVTSDKARTAGNEDGIRHETPPDVSQNLHANAQNGKSQLAS